MFICRSPVIFAAGGMGADVWRLCAYVHAGGEDFFVYIYPPACLPPGGRLLDQCLILENLVYWGVRCDV